MVPVNILARSQLRLLLTAMSSQPKGQPEGAKEKVVVSSLAGEDTASWRNGEEMSLMRNTLLFTDKTTVIISNTLNIAIKFK